MDLVREKLIELEIKIRSLSDVERLESIEEVKGLDDMINDMKSKIRQLNQVMEDSWEQIKGDIESSRNTINEAFERLNRSLV